MDHHELLRDLLVLFGMATLLALFGVPRREAFLRIRQTDPEKERRDEAGDYEGEGGA